MMDSSIHGYVDEGFEKVRTAFENNFRLNLEYGAACTIYYKGKKVVDLWGGYSDFKARIPWLEDTIVPVFSTTKGISSLAIAHAVSNKYFSYDDKVADVWKAFAQNGKENITIRQLLSHQAGLCALDRMIDEKIIENAEILSDLLAVQKPEWTPGDKQGYHCWNLGWYQSELIRKSDPQKRTLGRYFKQEIADVLGLDFYIGLPDNIDAEKIATLKSFSKALMPIKMPLGLVLSFFNPKSIVSRAMGNPKFLLNHHNLNDRKYQKLEIGSGNGIGNARSIAKLYNEFVTGGKNLNISQSVLQALEEKPVLPRIDTKDLVLHLEIPFSLGFMKPCKALPFGSSSSAYGFWGAGGSCGFADPETEVAYSYVMNKMGGEMFSDPREKSIRDAFYDCI
ncbi:MAG: beta-lactamase family protein [Geosporobacter ferrireducens]|nr:beta-lactamase family protein [Geosporobacter ferrireducens]